MHEGVEKRMDGRRRRCRHAGDETQCRIRSRPDEVFWLYGVFQLENILLTCSFYLQRVAYVYKAKREINGSKVRVMWGRISRSHGNSGVVKTKFRTNLPAHAFGASCRVVSVAFCRTA